MEIIERIEDGKVIKDYVSNGVTKFSVEINADADFSKQPIVKQIVETTIEEFILAENQYQTALLEMQSMTGGI